MGSDGVFSQGKFVDGIAPQSVEGDALDLMIGSVLRVERKRLPGLSVAYGVPATVRNRLDFVDIYWPSAPRGPIAYDVFPSRTDNVPLPGGLERGQFFHSQSVRRRAALARQGVAYLFRHDGDGPITAEHVSAAYKFVAEHKDDPAPEPENPLTRVTYEESATRNMGASFDPETGGGVRIVEK